MFIVFDLDGTLADNSDRNHFLDCEPKDWHGWHMACVSDKPYREVGMVFQALAKAGHKLEIWTGRSDIVETETRAWLRDHFGIAEHITLRMRQEGNFTEDTKLKMRWVEKFGKPDLVFEDRNRMVDAWREIGVTCFQVREGDF